MGGRGFGLLEDVAGDGGEGEREDRGGSRGWAAQAEKKRTLPRENGQDDDAAHQRGEHRTTDERLQGPAEHQSAKTASVGHRDDRAQGRGDDVGEEGLGGRADSGHCVQDSLRARAHDRVTQGL